MAYAQAVPGLRILTLAPRVDERDGVLRARTSWLVMLVTLGAIRREVVVDRRSGYVIIERRLLWLLRRQRVIPFRMIRRITYDYDRTVTSLRRTFDGGGASGDEVERFDVGLVVCTRRDVPESHVHLYEEHVRLFSFHGEGQSPDSVGVDFLGQQEQLSRRFVDRLRELTGAGFGLELEQVRDRSGRAWSCSSCGRRGPPRAGRCYYCGGQLEVEEGS